MRVPIALLGLSLAGCAAPLGSVGTLGAPSDLVATKLLRPGARARACRTAVLGVRVGGDERPLDAAVAQLLALDAEGDIVTNLRMRTSGVATGLYDRRCVELEGDLGRTIRTITLSVPGGHHDGH
ncbi:MAG TPA: hypothetical protein VFD84_12670 [Candidatus Binatia bacterium]|jgi:hypothetical protein|nr:hypothetical protein [Candidatus Binatia bacterium]